MTKRGLRGAFPKQVVLGLTGVLLPLALFAACAASGTGWLPSRWEWWILEYSDRNLYDPVVADAVRASLWASIVATALAGVVAFAYLGVRRRVRRAGLLALSVAVVLAADPLLKEIFRRPSLGEHAGYSFPSGTAALVVVSLAGTGLALAPRWRRLFVVIALSVVVGNGLALVYLWWHYPSDVVGGWCVGLACFAALQLAAPRCLRRRARRAHT